MPNPAPSSAAAGAVAAFPLPSPTSMAIPSPTPRLSTRKKNAAVANINTPVRRSSREPSTFSQENDSSLMVAGTVELDGGDALTEKASLPPSSDKPAEQAVDNHPRGEVLSMKPKLLKRSQQVKPSGGASAASASRQHLLKSLVSRSFLSFIVVAGLAAMFWSWRAPLPSFDGISMEGQVTELEEILRQTTKMMEVQFELIDMKIHKEIEGLAKELEEKIDGQATSFGTELHNMQAKTKDIEASLKSLTEAGFPSRHDVLNLITAVVEERATQGTGEALSLDDVRVVARRLVEVELEKHAADGIGRVDYALGTGGGKVVGHSEGFYHGLGTGWRQLTGSFLPRTTNTHLLANKILEPSFGEPGQCLPLRGSNVFVEIALRTSIFSDAFSLEHASKSVAYDVSSAPKEFRVFGWLDSYKKDDAFAKSMTKILLGEYVYNIEGKNVQTFMVPQDLRGNLVNTVRLEVLSNYGSPSHTCIYRFRVHGSDSLGVLASPTI